MTGFNLPPGVTEANLPGNRPEDELAEEWLRKLVALITEAKEIGLLTREEALDLLEDVWQFIEE